jgi:RNA polymerase sigma-70 factor (ECF subfamily)
MKTEHTYRNDLAVVRAESRPPAAHDSTRATRPPRVVELAVSDRDLLARLRTGDEDAFDTIFRAWYAPLVRFAERLVGAQAIAEEIVQDVMLELWQRRESLAEDGSAQAYLFQSTRNRAFNHLRHENVERKSGPFVQGPTSIDAPGTGRLVADELELAVRAAVNDLPDRCREVFELSRVHGLKYAEIAQTLEMSVKTVEAHMGRALRTLRQRLALWLPPGDRL